MQAQFQPETMEKPIVRASRKKHYRGSVGTRAVQAAVRACAICSLPFHFESGVQFWSIPVHFIYTINYVFLMYYAFFSPELGWLSSCIIVNRGRVSVDETQGLQARGKGLACWSLWIVPTCL